MKSSDPHQVYERLGKESSGSFVYKHFIPHFGDEPLLSRAASCSYTSVESWFKKKKNQSWKLKIDYLHNVSVRKGGNWTLQLKLKLYHQSTRSCKLLDNQNDKFRIFQATTFMSLSIQNLKVIHTVTLAFSPYCHGLVFFSSILL